MEKEKISIKGKAMKKEQELEEGDGFAYSFFNVAQSPVNKQCSPTLTTGNSCGVAVGVMEEDGIPIKDSSEKGYMIAHEGDSVSLQFPGNKGGPVQRGMTSSLLCAKGCANGVVVREDDKMYIRDGTKKGYDEAHEGDGVTLQYVGKARGVVQKGKSPTLMCSEGCGNGVIVRDDGNPVITAGDLHISPFYTANKVYSPDGMAPTILCAHSGIAHPKIEVAGEMTDTEFTQEKNVYSAEGLSPTILARDYKSPKKIEVAGEMTDTNVVQAKQVYSDKGVSPSVIGDGGSGSRIKIEVAGDLNIDNWHNRANAVCSTEGISATICATANNTRVKIEDPSEMLPEMDDGDVASMLTPGRDEKRQCGQRYKTDGNSFTVTCQDKHGIAEKKRGKLRIRYLTPRECWRLQGFSDEAFDRAVEIGASKTTLYTQAGNSIAVPCLEAIFKGIYIDKAFTKTFDITKW